MSSARSAGTFRVPEHEKAIRREAIDPGASVFLRANAGSGKTTILTNRVVRLLLADVDPTRILCVTYTKAAAAEMQDRIFRELASWVRLDDACLGSRIGDLTGAPPDAAALRRARRLFARAIETPGGLRLQTIHAFAERLLHLFPFEANVPVRFTVMDDADRDALIEEAQRATIRAALDAPDGPLGQAFSAVVTMLDAERFDSLLREAMPLLRDAPADPDGDDDLDTRLMRLIGIRPGDSLARMHGDILAGPFPEARWREWHGALVLIARRPTDIGFAAGLAAAIAAPTPGARAEALLDLFLTGEDKARDKIPLTADIAKLRPDITGAAQAFHERADFLAERRRAFKSLERSRSLTRLAADVLARFTTAKQARGLADYDDLIDRTRDLVANQGAQWVLRKLDQSIDHVLIDEAQDTSARMWTIMESLTDEFFAGSGARPRDRTVFAVGDEKQSIYTFQGADPAAFASARDRFRTRASKAELPFHDKPLQLSFRTVPDVLGAVDAVFSSPERARGLSADGAGTVHESARAGAPGHVEIWSPEPAPAGDARDVWEEVDAVGRNSAQVRLANRLAQHIRGLLAKGRFEDDGRPVRPGDIMILVQARSGIFDAVIRALKNARIPVAGADRMQLDRQIAVIDLVAAARVALLPEDDLTLASVLKSPLIGLTDADLLRIAPQRDGSLYEALAADTACSEAFAEIEAWRRLAREETPAGFFSTILGPRGGRRKLIARLGPDANDAIDVFLGDAIRRETQGAPSLVGVIEAFSASTTDVKRDQQAGGDVVRVLTVHGAKGLEARIVYMPDATQYPDPKKDKTLFGTEGCLLWAGAKADMPSAIAARAAASRDARINEYRRLLYVAMTRARDRLYVTGWEKSGATWNPDSWYGLISAGLAEAEEMIAEDGSRLRIWRKTTAPTPAIAAAPPPARQPTPLPSWIHQARREAPVAAPPLRPSRALDAADQPALPGRGPMRDTGTALHAVLERLPDIPAEGRLAYASTHLAALLPRLPEPERDRLAHALSDLVRAPAFAALFAPGSRAEVAVAGEVMIDGTPRPVMGRIDRLAIGPDRVLIADYKTGQPPGSGEAELPHLAQLALYRALVRDLYPDRRIDCVLVWTALPRIDAIAPARLDAALAAIRAT